MTTGQHLDPRALRGDPANDGYVLATQDGVPQWAAPGGIQSIVPGDGIDVDTTDTANPVVSQVRHLPLTTLGPDGPGILFAADGHIIYVEAP